MASSFPQTGKGGKSVRVVPGKGAVKVGPTHCVSKRAASNVKTTY